MAAQGEVGAVNAANMEGEDGFYDDPRSDPKKKKFKPFQKMKNFFRSGSSKKRFKVDEGVEPKSMSTSALHHKLENGEDDDDGGFRRKPAGLAGSRSISEDSIFQLDQKEPTIGVLQGHAVSMERINADFQSELFSKLKSRQSDSDIDEGLPYSPVPMGTSSHMLFEAGMKSGPVTGKSTSRESEKSLISVDGSDDDLFASNWKSGVASVKTRTSSMDSLPDDQMEVSDFEAVSMRTTTALSNEAAKHRISVKPKSRRLSSKVSFKKKERPSAQTQLPDLKEESPNKSGVDNSSEIKNNLHKTIISTTIPVGNPADSGVHVIPRSESKDIPRSTRPGEDLERSRPRSLSPLSTSPVSQAMIQDVKLRARPTSGKFDHVDVKNDAGPSGNELSNAFNKAKRFSKKYDDDGNVDLSKAGVKETEKETDSKKPLDTTKNVVVEKEELKSPTITTSKTLSAFSATTPTSPLSGVTFILKKEPLRPGASKVTDNVGAISTNIMDSKETTKTVEATKTIDATKTNSVTLTSLETEKDFSRNVPTEKDSNVQLLNKSPSKSPAGSPEKLASPRDDYRLKRQARSKTLPVAKEMLDKAEDTETAQRGSRLGSPPLSGRRNTPDYDNAVIGTKTIQSKRASWASPSGTTAQSQGVEPSWVVRAKLKQMEKDGQKESVKNEVNVEVKGVAQPSAASVGHKHEIHAQKSTEVAEKAVVASDVKTDVEKTQSSVRSWAQTHSAKPFEKPSVHVTAKPVEKVFSVQTGSVKSSFEKPSVQSVKPLSSHPTSIKSDSSNQFASVKPVMVSQPSSAKTTVASQPTTVKQTVSSISKPSFDKPVVSTTNKQATDKPLSQSVRSSQFGSKPGGFDRSFSQKPVTGVTKMDTSKPITRPLASINTNITKTVTKETDKQSSELRRTFSQEVKKVEIETKKETNSSLTNSSTGKQGSVMDKTSTGSSTGSGTAKVDIKVDTNARVPAWKQALTKKNTPPVTQPVKIEIIDKNINKKTDKPPEQKEGEKSSFHLKDKPKTAPEKCSDVAGNRSSKVLDMVKSFQKFQVT